MATSQELVWQYKYLHNWISYSSELNGAINEAYKHNQTSVKLKLKKTAKARTFKEIEVKLDEMVHTCAAENSENDIRRALRKPDGKYGNVIVPRFELGWQWEGDAEQWQGFSAEHMYAINEAVSKEQKSIKLTAGVGVQLEVKLDKMVQRNCKTGWERRIRCLVRNQSGMDNVTICQWKNDRGHYVTYNAAHTIEIEAAVRDDMDTVEITIGKETVTVDLNNKTQTNVVTKKIQDFQRAGSMEYKFPNELPPATVKPQAAKRPHSESASKASTSQTNLEEAEEEAEDVKPAKRTKSSAAKTKSQGSTQGPDIKTVRIATGRKVPVDSECHKMQGKVHVFIDGKDIYDAMLNQTNLKNNNNKYYIIQLLEDNSKKMYNVWFRWGRVGKSGQNSLVDCGHDLSKAKSTFERKYWDKTSNEWDSRDSFDKVAGKYDMLKMDYSVDDDKVEDEPDAGKVKKEKVESKLDERVQNLIQLICNLQAMEDMVVEMKYDAQKAPLGKLTVPQIKAGYAALKKIEHCINNATVGDKLIKACDDFYTRIPHNFGMRRPPIIKTKQELKDKIALLEALSDIQVAMTILKGTENVKEHPVDSQYHSLKCKLTPVEKKHKEFKMIEQYVQNSHAKTHNQYKMKVEEVFDMDKEGETENFNDVGNKMMLWHGSRLTNWAGILGQGLRIAPPEAPVTGYMFGKGVYFADMSSKSANYCFASRSKNDGLLLLSQVALGTTNDLLAADYTADKLAKGKHSVKGLGKIAPKAASDFTMPDGTVVPLGKGTDTGVINPNGYTLNYNEFIVYNTNQIRMRYLVRIKFNFN